MLPKHNNVPFSGAKFKSADLRPPEQSNLNTTRENCLLRPYFNRLHCSGTSFRSKLQTYIRLADNVVLGEEIHHNFPIFPDRRGPARPAHTVTLCLSLGVISTHMVSSPRHMVSSPRYSKYFNNLPRCFGATGCNFWF